MSTVEQLEGGMLTVQQAARELAVKESTIRAWIIRRRIGFVKLGRCVRIRRSEVARLIRENTTPARGCQR
jgi:excisionase family DNA binding protein